jgi:AraC-like DNA-binding protein/ligand-binding sensor protein
VVREATSNPVFERLAKSSAYLDYQHAFTAATGLPLALIPPEGLAHPHKDAECENAFCKLLAENHDACQACHEVQDQLRRKTDSPSKTVLCFAGLCDSAVPVRQGKTVVGFLQTGQILTRRPSRTRFKQLTRQISHWGDEIDIQSLEEAYLHTKVLPPEQYEAILQLLVLFAGQLSETSSHLALQESTREPASVTKARRFIQARHTEPLTLAMVSSHVRLGTFYFCKVFKKATGLTFTAYLARVRVEEARGLLSNQQLRVSEIAFQVGFQSLSQFNRIFHRITGFSPTQFRARLKR